MMKNPGIDPYVYPSTIVLKNKFNIRDAKELEKLEIKITANQSVKGIPKGNLDYDHLKKIHQHMFSELYDWAGKERTVSIAKGESLFAPPIRLESALSSIFKQLASDNHLTNLDAENFSSKAGHYFSELNAAHPFREGNGRTLRAFFDVLAEQAGFKLHWEKVTRQDYLEASIHSFHVDNSKIINVFRAITSPLSFEKNIPQKVNWLDNKFQSEWENLKQHKDKNIQWMLKFVELGQAKETSIEKEKINTSISELVKKLDVRSQEFKDLQTQAPTLMIQIQQSQLQCSPKNKGIEREN